MRTKQPSLHLPRQKPPMTLSPFEDSDSAALSLLSPPSDWAEERGKSHDPQLQLSRTSRHRAIAILSSHPNLASCFQPPKCSALRLAWPGTSIQISLNYPQPPIITPEPGRNSIPSSRGCWLRLRQLPLQLIPPWAFHVISAFVIYTNWHLSNIVSCSARTVSPTTSVCSRTTTASVNGGR